MIKGVVLLLYLISIVAGQSPPLQVGDTNLYILVKLNTELNLTCPFTDVDFYKWSNLKAPTNSLSDQRDLKIKLSSSLKSEIYECEAVNGYGKSTAIFITKAIDTNSKQFDIDCQSRETGPCFLVSGLSNEFEYTVKENSKIGMDCRAVMNSTKKGSLSYSWKKIALPESFEIKERNVLINQGMKNTAQLLDEVPPSGKLEYNSIDDMSKWGPIVFFNKATKEVDGLYQCIVASSTSTIRRTFRLRIKETKSTRTIEGPLLQYIKSAVGSTQTLHCKAYGKPKWGKKLENNEGMTESEGIIKWGEDRYKMLQGSLDIEHKANGGAVKDSSFYENNLKLENVQPSHSGIYVCTVLTSLALEHKFVNLSVEVGSGYSDSAKKNSNFPIYIAVPTTIFIICLATVIYCLVQRRIRQKSTFKNRVVRGTTVTTTNSSSGNGSCSGSRNTSNPRHHMLTTNTNSSKGSQNQFAPTTCFSGNAPAMPGYGTSHPAFSSGYTPAVMSYNFAGSGPYVQATNNTPNSTELDHPCSHHNCMSHNGMSHNGHPLPYDSDSTPSPPPPTSVTDPVSQISAATSPAGLAPFSVCGGGSLNSYSPNQSSQIYIQNPTPNGSSSTSVSSPNVIYATNLQQQPVYPVGVMYSA